MQEEYQMDGSKMIYFMPEEVDHHQATQIQKTIDQLIDMYQIRTLYFDFGGTRFMDSSGIGVLIGRSRKLGFLGGKVYAQNIGGRVERIFTASGLYQMIDVVKEDGYEH